MAKKKAKAAATATPAKTGPAQGQGISKAQFILQQPMKMPASQVVKKAKEEYGLDISPNYVHVIRSKYRQGMIRKREGRGARNSGSRAVATSTSRNLELEFRRLAIELGLERAQYLLDDTRQKLMAIFEK